MSKRLSVTLTCPPLPHQGLESFILGLLMKSTSQILRMPFKNPCHVPTGRRSQGSLIYMFGYADRRCLCSEDLRTFCGRVCFPLSATIIIQYISEKACCSPERQMYNWPSLSEWRRCILGQRRRRTTTRTAARQKYRKGQTLTFCPTSSPGVTH